MIQVVVLGATGSIGRSAADVLSANKDLYSVHTLAACKNIAELSRQCDLLAPRQVITASEEKFAELQKVIGDRAVSACGMDAMIEAVTQSDVDMVLCSIIGTAGIKPVLAALKAGKHVALASKEVLVLAGELVMKAAAESKGGKIVPVDSEHSGVFQCLAGRRADEIRKVWLTASGGPFRNLTYEQMLHVTAAQALQHPNCEMGAKITIDSATLLNKGFEVIEAKWLYNCPLEKIHTIVQPESIIHSLVEFEDKGILAQMSYPTMELPIQLALTYPDRFDCALQPLDFEKLGAIRFLPLERSAFPCYDMALKSIELGDNYPCALNGAGEVAVRAFLEGKLPFLGIAEAIEYALEKTERVKATDYGALVQTDEKARLLAREFVAKRIE